MAFQVYTVGSSDQGNNTYSLSRVESRSLIKDLAFSTQAEAEEYVIRQNRRMNAHTLTLMDVTDPAILRARCLTDPAFLTKRTYHLVSDPATFEQEYIRQLLLRDGDDFHVILDPKHR